MNLDKHDKAAIREGEAIKTFLVSFVVRSKAKPKSQMKRKVCRGRHGADSRKGLCRIS